MLFEFLFLAVFFCTNRLCDVKSHISFASVWMTSHLLKSHEPPKITLRKSCLICNGMNCALCFASFLSNSSPVWFLSLKFSNNTKSKTKRLTLYFHWQDFCDKSYHWPLQKGDLQIAMSRPGKSCTDTCFNEGTMFLSLHVLYILPSDGLFL